MINVNFNSILDLIKAFPDEQTCINHLTELRWNGNIVSPFDADSKVYVCKDNNSHNIPLITLRIGPVAEFTSKILSVISCHHTYNQFLVPNESDR